ncbi:hypothetical protein GCM10010273_54510 [Streptomyces lavendulocolor]
MAMASAAKAAKGVNRRRSIRMPFRGGWPYRSASGLYLSRSRPTFLGGDVTELKCARGWFTRTGAASRPPGPPVSRPRARVAGRDGREGSGMLCSRGPSDW